MRKILAALVAVPFVIALFAPPAAAANSEIHISSGAPVPAEITIGDGDTVTFVNEDDVEHAIFAGGVQRGDTIPPHGVGGPFGPFQTGGQRGTFDYRVDRGGPPGRVIVDPAGAGGGVPGTTATTSPPVTTPRSTTTSTSPFATSTTTTTVTNTTTTLAPTTTVATTAPESGSTGPAVTKPGGSDDSTKRLAVLGVMLLVAGLVGLVLVVGNRLRGPRGQP